MKEETEGGYIYYKTENKELIQQIIEAIKNIQIGEKVDLTFSDNGRYYTIEYYDGTTTTYYFQSNYYNKDNINYETYNYDKLKEINIPKENINK
ncbi:unknown [Clostridium sp. CAG:1219]|nr:unknown [Clostridium sp. CAG:1219]